MSVEVELPASAAEYIMVQATTQPMEGVEQASRPPSPPTRPDTPNNDARLPARLPVLIPAKNFGAVKDRMVYRSAFPQDRNLKLLQRLHIKTILCFVDTEPTEGYLDYVRSNRVTRVRIDILANKDGNVSTTVQSICQALLVAMDIANYPLYIHCNQGKHRTGCVIACMRKVQGWPMAEILREYEAYAYPKARPGDVKFITEVFQPEMLLEYATQHGDFSHHPALGELLEEKALTLAMFTKKLGSYEGVEPSDISLASARSKADSGVALDEEIDPEKVSDWLKKFVHNPEVIAADGESREPGVSVIECEDLMSHPVGSSETRFFASMA